MSDAVARVTVSGTNRSKALVCSRSVASKHNLGEGSSRGSPLFAWKQQSSGAVYVGHCCMCYGERYGVGRFKIRSLQVQSQEGLVMKVAKSCMEVQVCPSPSLSVVVYKMAIFFSFSSRGRNTVTVSSFSPQWPTPPTPLQMLQALAQLRPAVHPHPAVHPCSRVR